MQNNANLEQLTARIDEIKHQLDEVIRELELLKNQPVDTLPTTELMQHMEEQPLDDSQASQDEEIEIIPIVGRKGVFDGIFMITEDGKKFQVPPNYVSKSMLVVGDRLEIVEVDETGSKYSFKQIENVERKEIDGILTKKDNQWAVHTEEGIFYVVAAAVRFHKADVGDQVKIVLPAKKGELPIEWAAFKEITKQSLREKFEPRAKQYMQPKLEDKEDSQGEASEVKNDTDIVKSRLGETKPTTVQSSPQVAEEVPSVQQDEPVVAESVQGEVEVPSVTSEPHVGEITLLEEDEWELR